MPGIITAAEALFGFMFRHWKLILTGLVVAALSTMLVIRSGQRDAARGERDAAQQALKQTKLDYKIAQAAARVKAMADKMEAEARFAKLKEQADDAIAAAQDDASARLAAYAARNRVQPQSTAQGSAGRADLPGTAAASEVDHGPGANALVAVSLPDLEICTVNSVRLLNAHGWAAELEAR